MVAMALIQYSWVSSHSPTSLSGNSGITGTMKTISGIPADDMHAGRPIGFRFCENLHEAFGGLVALGAAIGGEREFSDGVGDARLLQFVLGLADRRHFRRGIHDPWYNIVVHMAGLAG